MQERDREAGRAGGAVGLSARPPVRPRWVPAGAQRPSPQRAADPSAPGRAAPRAPAAGRPPASSPDLGPPLPPDRGGAALAVSARLPARRRAAPAAGAQVGRGAEPRAPGEDLRGCSPSPFLRCGEIALPRSTQNLCSPEAKLRDAGVVWAEQVGQAAREGPAPARGPGVAVPARDTPLRARAAGLRRLWGGESAGKTGASSNLSLGGVWGGFWGD